MTEIFTNYPLPPWHGAMFPDTSLPADRLDDIVRHLGAIEQRLSRIEELMIANQPKE